MSRPPRGRRSSRKPSHELIVEIHEAVKEWEVLPLDDRMKAGWKHEPAFRYGAPNTSDDHAPSSFVLWHAD
ncbi:MAG TPA: hypothetical protein VGP63_29185 [Planctomycetaceae bacterium]|jgi:hypothetical protein|nr:hypothetical protein [Planctomycetaceae bacterium]